MNHFSKAAASWENTDRLELAENIWKCMEANMLFQADMKAADIGAGTGLLTVKLAAITAHVTAVDNSKEMLEILNEKISRLKIKNISILVADAEKESMQLFGLGAIISSMSLHHMQDTLLFIKKAYEALLPGGILGIADLDMEDGGFHKEPAKMGVMHPGFERKSLEEKTTAAGFRDIRFYDAASVIRIKEDGSHANYPVFLMTAVKK